MVSLVLALALRLESLLTSLLVVLLRPWIKLIKRPFSLVLCMFFLHYQEFKTWETTSQSTESADSWEQRSAKVCPASKRIFPNIPCSFSFHRHFIPVVFPQQLYIFPLISCGFRIFPIIPTPVQISSIKCCMFDRAVFDELLAAFSASVSS